MFAITTDHALTPRVPSCIIQIKQRSLEFIGLLPNIFSSTHTHKKNNISEEKKIYQAVLVYQAVRKSL